MIASFLYVSVDLENFDEKLTNCRSFPPSNFCATYIYTVHVYSQLFDGWFLDTEIPLQIHPGPTGFDKQGPTVTHLIVPLVTDEQFIAAFHMLELIVTTLWHVQVYSWVAM